MEFLENICFADVSKEDVTTISDESFVKLFRLTQLIIEYLLNVQDEIYGQSVDVAKQYDKVVRKLKVSTSMTAKCTDHWSGKTAAFAGFGKTGVRP